VALLNQLIAEGDLAKMSRDEIDFLADRIDNILNEAEVQKLITARLEHAVGLVAPEAELVHVRKS